MTETKPTKARYTDEEVRTALRIHASVNGRLDLIKKMLAAEGLEIKTATVRDWATRRHKDLYLDIRNEFRAYVRAHAADRYRAVADLATDVMDEALRQSMEALKRGELKPERLPGIAQKAAISAGVSSDKSQILDGEPDSIVRTPADVDGITQSLAMKGVKVVVAGVDVAAQATDPTRPAIDVAALPRTDDGKIDGNPDEA